MTRHKQAVSDDQPLVERQRLLLELEEDALRSEKEKTTTTTASRRTQSSAARIDVATLIQETCSRLEARLTRLEELLEAMRGASVSTAPAKDYYTTAEAAQLLGKRTYTVREWCRLGRVNAEKAAFGRGLDEEWRISHDELVRIQNEGLLRLQPASRLRTVRRLGS